MGSKYRFVVNAESGDVLYRSEVTDKLPIIFRLIDDDTANAIFNGKVTGKQIAEAALKKDMSAEGFDYAEYDKRRQAAKKARCMSEREMIPVSEPKEEIRAEDHPEAVLSLSDIGVEKDSDAKTEKKNQAHSKKEESGY